MIRLQPIIDRIKALLAEDTDASVTYAALEARLALEKVAYDRLRQRHDYISHAQLRAWTPGEVVKRLLQEVDEHVTKTQVLSMSRGPYREGARPEEEEWIEIGTEIGFDAKKIARMWQALSNLALHVRLPKSKDDQIADYGDKKSIRAKVDSVLAELERLSKGTMTFSGIMEGGEVSFECSCHTTNKRRIKLLKNGQFVFCINPECDQTWKVHIDGDEVGFENVVVEVPCKICGVTTNFAWRTVTKMKYDQMIQYSCHACSSVNFVKWQLAHAAQTAPDKTNEKQN